mmetsp:Transcript_33300/g.60189  ORF Transcript_33300/g.60189 Transcript_33300/m.60189 type:complete len:244 (-) Transcript_33300:103-834(-)|eukprot:CAMPEP_0175056650 /NCGR_PEP_ID=MMETSP0052_2-20121109/10800_1 /TAXON_ID=51329 ORGANISM="Polytomella parva, Strain SAG 63-3" /NCGR_SAMPLE_ID=MMETSP0052_2 /ASSEMBLY_ACC=CAM_ASM_000194 /LENGTH=243 /DNA_ID=CAMNT_0016321723 /DNA_START=59 /DNA_END=790 /DNA_ORIENTATION=-
MSDSERVFKSKKPKPVGAGLSLEKFATAGFSKYDKRKKIEKLKKEKIINYSKYLKIKKKFESTGAFQGTVEVKDAIAELEELDSGKRKRDTDEDDSSKQQPNNKKQFRSENTMDRINGSSYRAKKKQDEDNDEEVGDETAKGSDSKNVNIKGFPNKKPYLTKIQKVAFEAQLKKEEKERIYEEARIAREERERHVAEAEKRRRQQKHQFYRKTSSGQPLMSVRVDKILGILEKEQKQMQGKKK